MALSDGIIRWHHGMASWDGNIYLPGAVYGPLIWAGYDSQVAPGRICWIHVFAVHPRPLPGPHLSVYPPWMKRLFGLATSIWAYSLRAAQAMSNRGISSWFPEGSSV